MAKSSMREDFCCVGQASRSMELSVVILSLSPHILSSMCCKLCFVLLLLRSFVRTYAHSLTRLPACLLARSLFFFLLLQVSVKTGLMNNKHAQMVI